MTDRSWLEARVAALIASYADQAPTAIDPTALARLVASDAARRRGWPAIGPWLQGPAWVGIALALLAALVTSVVVVGSQFARRQSDELRGPQSFVAPFVGIAPEGVGPSTPADGELVAGFEARLGELAVMHYRMWLLADGRLIWTSEGGNHGLAPRGAVVEQRLTPVGVELVRARIAAATSVVGPTWIGDDIIQWGRPGTIWGGLQLAAEGRLFEVTWTHDDLPTQLVDPASWLPAAAWDDVAVHGFVPARYAVCSWLEDQAVDPAAERVSRVLPTDVRAAVATGEAIPPGTPQAPICRAVDLAVGRSIVAGLSARGHDPNEGDIGPRYVFHLGAPRGELTIDVVPMVPSGDVVCNCG